MKPYYSDDAVTIYHGDCREWMPEATVLMSDPPYGLKITHGRNFSSGSIARGRVFKSSHGATKVVGDDQPFDPSPLLGFPKVILFGANHYADKLPPSPSWIVLDKRVDTGIQNDQADCELIWTNCGGPARMYRQVWNGLAVDSDGEADHLRALGRGHTRLHPTQKPVRLMRWLIERYTKPGDVILDPFMGSGTTLRAAKDCGRKAIGIEIEERYCAVAVQRLAQEVLGLGEPAA